MQPDELAELALQERVISDVAECIRKLRAERDDLLEACRAALTTLDENAACYHSRAIPILRTAIARAEGEADQ